MADPLSVGASIIAVLQLSPEVVSYISTVKGAPAEWKRLKREIQGLENIFETCRKRMVRIMSGMERQA